MLVIHSMSRLFAVIGVPAGRYMLASTAVFSFFMTSAARTLRQGSTDNEVLVL